MTDKQKGVQQCSEREKRGDQNGTNTTVQPLVR